jgi:hypothetical protein
MCGIGHGAVAQLDQAANSRNGDCAGFKRPFLTQKHKWGQGCCLLVLFRSASVNWYKLLTWPSSVLR